MAEDLSNVHISAQLISTDKEIKSTVAVELSQTCLCPQWHMFAVNEVTNLLLDLDQALIKWI